jgi:hypothetical protein
LSTDFSQSSAYSGSTELENVGGLWLINSRCLSLGGAGGGGGGVVVVAVVVFPVILVSSLDVSPPVPGVLASSDFAFHSSCLPFAIASAFGRQPLDRF